MKKISALTMAGVFAASLAGTAFAEMADVKINGEIRLRDEWKNNYYLDSSAGDQYNMILQRTRVNVDAKIDEKTKAYVSLENNRDWGSSGPAYTNGVTTTTNCNGPDGLVNTADDTCASTSTNNDSVGLYEGYVVLDKLFDQPLFFKAGRQKIALGSQRLIGANDWGAGQAFDGWILGYNHDAFSAALFAVTGADNNSTTTTANGMVNGLYVTLKSVPMNTVDVYAIQKAVATATGESFITYGARIDGNAINIDWNAEVALQTGDAATGSTKNANAIWLVAGYTIPHAAGLRIGAEYDQLSGSKSTDTDNKSFDQLFRTGHSTSAQHSVYGITDIVENSATNPVLSSGLTAFSINASAKPVEGLKLLAEYWNFSSAENFNNAAETGTATAIGNEMNLQVWYDVSKSTAIHAYYAQFTPSSDFSAKTDAATDAVLQLCVKF